MKNIVVTAGGTSEPIDGVRSITNTGTGKLGSIIADRLAECGSDVRVYYIHAKNAVLPSSENVDLISIETTQDLLSAVKKLFSEKRIDAVIHSMAVSDYYVDSVVTAETLLNDGKGFLNKQELLNYINKNDVRGAYNKLPSGLQDPVILLKQTPKILPLFRQLSPGCMIVGFKLLCDVSHDTLIDIAFRLLEKNSCDFVLANDYSTVRQGLHTGYLIDRERNEREFIGKDNIASGIVNAVLTGGIL